MYYFIDASLCRSTDWDYQDRVEAMLKDLTSDGDYIFIVGQGVPNELSSYGLLDINSDHDVEISQWCFENGLPFASCVYVTDKPKYKESGHLHTIVMKRLVNGVTNKP